MYIGNKYFDFKEHCYIMGILNVTPDSFTDGGKWNELESAKKHTEEMIRDGAAIIDVGGESTRPGYERVSDEEEISRVVPVIEMIKKNFDVAVSIDTYKSAVAKAALDAGADMVNDIWGLKGDEKLAEVIAQYQVPCCLMYNRQDIVHENFMEDLLENLRETLAIAKKAGIKDEKIILDPGVGFKKAYEQNLAIIYRLRELEVLGYPLLLGASRKFFIGRTLDVPADQRVEGTMATSAVGVLNGASILRVHDVKENYRVMKMTEAILKEGQKSCR